MGTPFAVSLCNVESVDGAERGEFSTLNAAAASIVAGGSLFSAAILKTIYLHNNPVGSASLLGSRAASEAVVCWEIAISVALVFAVTRRLTHYLAFATFAVFAGYNVVGFISGKASCGCLGQTTVKPSIMVVFDLGVASWLFFAARLFRRTTSALGPRVFAVSVSTVWPPMALISILCLGAIHYTRPPALTGDTALAADAAAVDFGTHEAVDAKELKHVFRISNRTNHAVRILNVLSSCGCTIPNLQDADRTIEAGSFANLPVTVNWSTRLGRQHEEVFVESDAAKDALVLEVSGIVSQTYTFDPTRIDFGSLEQGEETTRRFDIFDLRPGHVLHARDINVDIQHGGPETLPLVKSVDESGTGLNRVSVQLSLTASADLGARSGYFQVKLPDMPKPFDIPWQATFTSKDRIEYVFLTPGHTQQIVDVGGNLISNPVLPKELASLIKLDVGGLDPVRSHRVILDLDQSKDNANLGIIAADVLVRTDRGSVVLKCQVLP